MIYQVVGGLNPRYKWLVSFCGAKRRIRRQKKSKRTIVDHYWYFSELNSILYCVYGIACNWCMTTMCSILALRLDGNASVSRSYDKPRNEKSTLFSLWIRVYSFLSRCNSHPTNGLKSTSQEPMQSRYVQSNGFCHCTEQLWKTVQCAKLYFSNSRNQSLERTKWNPWQLQQTPCAR